MRKLLADPAVADNRQQLYLKSIGVGGLLKSAYSCGCRTSAEMAVFSSERKAESGKENNNNR